MLIQHIALVPEADGIEPSELARVSAALQKQVMRDLSPAWGVSATVDAFPRLEDVPVGYWPILVTRCAVGMESGVHLDRDGTPYAQVEYSADSEWSLDASRACLEMLVNPFGKRTVSAPSPRSDQGRVEVVVEVCGPCGDALCAYAINDVVVSDFCLPAFYEEGPVGAGKRLTVNGSLGAPFRVLAGGHITWFDVVSESYWRRSHWGENPVDSRLGRLPHAASSSRELGPRSLPARLRASSPAHEAFQARVEIDREHAKRISELRALRLRASFLESSASGNPSRVLLMQEARELEPVTMIDLTDEEPELKRTPTLPPPLPARALRPAPSSTAPVSVSVVREPEKGLQQAPLAIALAIAAAAAVAFFATRPSTITVSEAARSASTQAPATIAAPAETAAPVAPVPPLAPTPIVAPTEAPVATVLAAAEPKAAAAEPKAAAAEPKAAAPKKTKRAKAAPAPSSAAPVASPVAPPAPQEPVLTVKPTAEPQPVAVATPSEPASIDALIDTRR